MTYSKGKDLNIAHITPPSITSQGVSGILLPTQEKIPEQPVKIDLYKLLFTTAADNFVNLQRRDVRY